MILLARMLTFPNVLIKPTGLSHPRSSHEHCLASPAANLHALMRDPLRGGVPNHLARWSCSAASDLRT